MGFTKFTTQTLPCRAYALRLRVNLKVALILRGLTSDRQVTLIFGFTLCDNLPSGLLAGLVQ